MSQHDSNNVVNKVVYDGDTLIDLTNDTVTARDLSLGVTAHQADGTRITGTANYVLKTGDTMSGNLVVEKSQQARILLKSSDIILGRSGNSDREIGLYGTRDANDNFGSFIQTQVLSNGDSCLTLHVNGSDGSSLVQNYLKLISKTSGACEIEVASPDGWKRALGYADGTDSGWKNLSGSNYNGNVNYRKIGDFVCVKGYAITLKNGINASSYFQFSNVIPSGYRPDSNICFSASSNTIVSQIKVWPMLITSGGIIYLYSNSDSGINNSTSINFCITYMIG